MAIQPIDLQILFNQLDNVGKNQAFQKEGLQMQQALQGAQIQKKTEERVQSVAESQDTGEGAEAVKDRSSRQQNGQKDGEAPAGKDAGDEVRERLVVIRDPALGKNIDVSG
jgi:hypothetical protein